MRFIMTALLWLALIGGLSLYIQQRDARLIPQGRAQLAAPLAGAAYLLEVTPSFGAEADPFALRAAGQSPATLLVRLGGQEVFRSEQPLGRGETLRIEPLDGLVVGNNELYFEASPSFDEARLSHALRVRLLRNAIPLLDRTLWSEAGGKVSGTVAFRLAEFGEVDHEH